MVSTESCSRSRPSPSSANVRHVFLLAGQSNMAGRGVLSSSSAGAPDDRIAVLDAEGHWKSPAVHPLHYDKPERAGVGPGLAFARAVIDFLPEGERRIGLLPCAFGGSALARWDPKREGSLFRAAVQRVQEVLGEVGGGSRLSGILWHQGETDSGSIESANAYEFVLVEVITALRSACGDADLPTILGELPRFINVEDPRFRLFCEVSRATAAAALALGPRVAVVSTASLGHRGDRLHFSAAAADELGRRYAWKWLAIAGLSHASLRDLAGFALEPPLLDDEAESDINNTSEPKFAGGEPANCAVLD